MQDGPLSVEEKNILKFFRISPSELEGIYSTFKEEVERFEDNGGRLIIPRVVIKGRTFTLELEDLEVKSHKTRNDALGKDVATALDVIMTMGDQERITYELKWYESIGTASVVKSCWIEAINGYRTQGRCGFVYEEGAELKVDAASYMKRGQKGTGSLEEITFICHRM